MDVSTPPSLDLACPQAITELDKHDHSFMEWSVDKQNMDKQHHIYQGTSHNRQQLVTTRKIPLIDNCLFFFFFAPLWRHASSCIFYLVCFY
jgi:hypothetical protein